MPRKNCSVATSAWNRHRHRRRQAKGDLFPMITEDQLEQLAIQWFEETGWTHLPGSVIAPEGVAAEREDFRAVVLKGRLAEAVRRLNPKQRPSSRPSPTGRRRKTAEREALRTLSPALCLRPSPLRSGSHGKKEEDGRLAARRREAMPGQVSHEVTKSEHSMGRPFRAWNPVGDGTQGVALGCLVVPRWGGRRWATCKDRSQVRFERNQKP